MLCSKMMLFFMNILVLCILVVSADPLQYRTQDSATTPVSEDNELNDPAGNINSATTPVSEDNELNDPAGNIRDFKHKGVSYQLMTERLSFEDAKTACVGRNGYLVTVYSKDLNDEIVEQLKSAGSFGSAWIGYEDMGYYGDVYKKRLFEWQNPYGTCNKFFNWRKYEPADPKYLEKDRSKYMNCVILNTAGGGWSTDYCTNARPFICEMATDASQVGCKDVIEYKGEKYKYVFKWLKFESAEKNCQKLGGHLVTIYEEGLQNAIAEQVTQNVASDYGYDEGPEVWIGYRGNEKGSAWEWRNPSASCFKVKYTNWKEPRPLPNHQNCILLSVLPSMRGKWGTFSKPCGDSRPSVCELGVKKDLCASSSPSSSSSSSGPDSNTAHYKPWGSWGRCTEPCGGGEQTRYRECQGPKELCEHRINSDKRDCNMDACQFPKKSIDGVKYYETDDGMCLSDFSKEECEKIAKGLKARHPKIVNKDTWFFPHGCYHSIKHNFVFYNEKPSTKRCDEERRCICRIALGKGQLIDWIYGDESVNPGKNEAPRHTPDLEPDYRAEMVEEKYVSDAVKKNQFTPGENLYELMDEM